MSALPPKADIAQHGADVRLVPKADIGEAARRVRSGPDSALLTDPAAADVAGRDAADLN